MKIKLRKYKKGQRIGQPLEAHEFIGMTATRGGIRLDFAPGMTSVHIPGAVLRQALKQSDEVIWDTEDI